MNITGSREGIVFFIDDDKVMIDGKLFYEEKPCNLAKPSVKPLLSDVLAEMAAISCIPTDEIYPAYIREKAVREVLSKYFT